MPNRSIAISMVMTLVACGPAPDASTTTIEPIIVRPGTTTFTPPPPRFAGGPVPGTDMDPTCVGWFPSSPTDALEVPENLPDVIVYAMVAARGEARGEITLAIRDPRGTFRCSNRAPDGVVFVAGPLAAGRHDIFVGTRTQGQELRYGLALTTRRELSPSDFPAAEAEHRPGEVVTRGLLRARATVPGVVDATQECRVTATITPRSAETHESLWVVACGGREIYRAEGRTYDPSWDNGVLASDTLTTGSDGTPSFQWDTLEATIRDDASGAHGRFSAEFDTMPIPLPAP